MSLINSINTLLFTLGKKACDLKWYQDFDDISKTGDNKLVSTFFHPPMFLNRIQKLTTCVKNKLRLFIRFLYLLASLFQHLDFIFHDVSQRLINRERHVGADQG